MGCEFTWQGRSVLKTFTGFVSGGAFIETAETVSAHPQFDALRVIYNDFSGIRGHGVDAEVYGHVAACRLGAMATNPNFRVAFIVSGLHAEALHRAVATSRFSAPFDPVFFSTLDEARDWFDRQAPLDGPRGHLWQPVPTDNVPSDD